MEGRITKRAVDALAAGPEGREVVLWDTEVSGFGVRVRGGGVKTFILKYRAGRGRGAPLRKYVIGRHGSPWTTDEAREEAQRVLGQVKNGADPAAARTEERAAPTMADLCERFLNDHASAHKKPLSVLADRRNIRNHVIPLLGKLRVRDVTRADIDRLKHAIAAGKTATDHMLGPGRRVVVTGGSGAANRCMALLSKMFNLAELWGLRPDGTNPCRHVEKFREKRVERFLSSEELARLGEALAAYDGSPYAVATIKLLVFTGARVGEILTLRWEWINLERGEARLPDSKSGAKTLHLPPPALEVLSNLLREAGNPYVIVGSKKGAGLVNIEKPWRMIRAAAGMSDVRLHDLRHAFASIAASQGMGLPIIGKMLGHSQPATTARYAHLASDPVKAAAAAVAAQIAAAMNGGSDSGASVLPFRANN